VTAAGSEITVLAPAKLNLGLEVLGVRGDGFHEVVTILQAIRLHDTIRLRRSRSAGIDLSVHPGAVDLGPVERNLAVRAARAVISRWGCRGGVAISLHKRVPAGAGMGGGSSDAAAVLTGMVRLLGIPATHEELVHLAAGLGSDVPFFLRGGTQLATGRGEILHPMIPWPGRLAVVVFPNLSVSTSSIYRRGKWGLTPQGPLSSILPGAVPADFWLKSGQYLKNDLASVVEQTLPVVGRLLREFGRLKSGFTRVTGSGSGVFGIPPDADTGMRWAESFREQGYWARVVRPSRRGCLIRL